MKNEKNNTDEFYLFWRFNLLTLLSALALAGIALTWLLSKYFG